MDSDVDYDFASMSELSSESEVEERPLRAPQRTSPELTFRQRLDAFAEQVERTCRQAREVDEQIELLKMQIRRAEEVQRNAERNELRTLQMLWIRNGYIPPDHVWSFP